MGFERPNPDKKQGKNNNLKMSFDAEARKKFIEITEKHGVVIEQVPLEGKVHMKKKILFWRDRKNKSHRIKLI